MIIMDLIYKHDQKERMRIRDSISWTVLIIYARSILYATKQTHVTYESAPVQLALIQNDVVSSIHIDLIHWSNI